MQVLKCTEVTIEHQQAIKAEQRAAREALFAANPIKFAAEYGFGEWVDGVFTRYEEWEESSESGGEEV